MNVGALLMKKAIFSLSRLVLFTLVFTGLSNTSCMKISAFRKAGDSETSSPNEKQLEPHREIITSEAQDEAVVLTWPNTSASEYVIFQSAASQVRVEPADGATYQVGQTVSNSTVIYGGSGSQAKIESLQNGIPYYFAIYRKDVNQHYELIAIVRETPVTKVTRPSTFAINTGDNTLYLSWTSGGNQKGYLLVRSATGPVTFRPVKGTQYYLGQALEGDQSVVYLGSDLSFRDLGLANNTRYFYNLYAFSSTYSYSDGYDSYRTPVQNAAASPTIKAVPADGKITLSWTLGSTNPEGALLLRRSVIVPNGQNVHFTNNRNYNVGQSSDDNEHVILYKGSSLTFTDSNLTNGVTQYYTLVTYANGKFSTNTAGLSSAPVGSTAKTVDPCYCPPNAYCLPRSGCGATGTAPASLAVASVNFADQAVNTSQDKTVQITNSGDTEAIGLTASISSGVFSFEGGNYPGTSGTCGVTLPAKSSCTVAVRLLPTTGGIYFGTLTVQHSVGSATGNLSGAGGEPKLEVANIDFGKVKIKNYADVSISVKNTGNVSSQNITASLLGAGFGFVGGVYPGTGGSCQSTLAALSNCTLKLRFTPVFVGPSLASLTLDYSNKKTIASLSGSGLASPDVITNVSVLDFGTLNIGKSLVFSIAITNVGTGIANSVSGNVTGTGFSFYGNYFPGSTGTCKSTLAASKTCYLMLQFVPGVEGDLTGALNLTVDGATKTVALKGSGTKPGGFSQAFEISGGDFGQVPMGSSNFIYLSVRNNSSRDLTNIVANFNSGLFSFDNQNYPGPGSTCQSTIPANSACTLRVTFVSGYSDAFTARLTLTASSGETASAILSARAMGSQLSVSDLNFGRQVIGVPGGTKLYATITNTGTLTSYVEGMRITDSTAFEIVDSTCDVSLAAGAQCQVGIVFKPTSIFSNGYLEISENARVIKAWLWGGGIIPANVIASPREYEYGDVVLGKSKDLSVTLSNNSPADVNIATSSFIFPSGFGFAGSGIYPGDGGNCGATLPAYSSCNISVKFTPKSRSRQTGFAVFTYGDTTAPVSPNFVVKGDYIKRFGVFVLGGTGSGILVGTQPQSSLEKRHAGSPYPWEGSGAFFGNFQAIIPLTTTGLSLVHNSLAPDLNYGFGNGFRLSIDRRIIIKDTTHLDIENGDGTPIPFILVEGIWKCIYPTLSDSTIELSGTIYIEKNPNGSMMRTYSPTTGANLYALTSVKMVGKPLLNIVRNSSGFITSISDAQNNSMLIAYSDGVAQTLIDWKKKEYKFSYTSANQSKSQNLSKMQMPALGFWAVAYTNSDLISAVTDPHSFSTTISYDESNPGTIQSIRYPLSGTYYFTRSENAVTISAYSYEGKESFDSSFALIESISNNVAVQFAWDENRNLLTTTNSYGETLTYTYENGKPHTYTTPTSVETYTWNLDGTLKSKTKIGTNGKEFITQYTYNSNKDVSNVSGPGDYSMAISYDTYRNITSVVENGNIRLAAVYDPFGNILSQSLDGEPAVNFTYDANGQLVQMSTPTGVYQYTRSNNAAGTVSSVSGPLVEQSYSYNALGLPTQVSMSGNGANYNRSISYTNMGSYLSSNSIDTYQNGYQEANGLNFTENKFTGPGRVGQPVPYFTETTNSKP